MKNNYFKQFYNDKFESCHRCAAIVSPSYELSWSKWNLDKSRRDKIIFLVREKDSTVSDGQHFSE